MYEADISKASVMALFLLPVNLNKLAPKFLDLTPGSRIVGNTFGIDGWEPDVRAVAAARHRVRELVRSAAVDRAGEGPWHVDAVERHGCNLTQEYQTVQGTRDAQRRAANTVTKGRMNGEEITFVAGGADLQRQGQGQPHRGDDHDGEAARGLERDETVIRN